MEAVEILVHQQIILLLTPVILVAIIRPLLKDLLQVYLVTWLCKPFLALQLLFNLFNLFNSISPSQISSIRILNKLGKFQHNHRSLIQTPHSSCRFFNNYTLCKISLTLRNKLYTFNICN
eukprot:NODE_484_length_7802_cov_0.227184.p7 type:complete len:120 gc:universal NODE_484_length_7802_cov_0.227184:1770-2129(+)